MRTRITRHHCNLLILGFVVAALGACSSSNTGSAVTDGELATTDSLSAEVASQSIPVSLPAAARAFLFDYTMTGVLDSEVTARAQLFEPIGDVPAAGYPLVVWAHGTTGIANDCTPSASFSKFGNSLAINALLSEGYAVLAPDYEGFGTPQIHPYYIRSSHADAVLAAVPAAHRVDGTSLSDDWAIVGHSQGGHVALATARGTQDPAYLLQAVVALAPGTDLVPFSDRAFEAIDLAIANNELQIAAERTFYLNVYGAFVAHAVQLVEPGFVPASIFGDAVSPLIDQAVTETECGTYVDAVTNAINQHVASTGTVSDFSGLLRNWYDNPIIASRLDREELGDEAQSMPLLIVQGDADRQVPVAATTAFVDRQRSVGTDVTYEIVPGGRHGDVSREEFARTITWLADKFPAR